MKIDLADATVAIIRQNMKPLATVDSTLIAMFRDFQTLQETAKSLVKQNGDLIAEVRRLTATIDSLKKRNQCTAAKPRSDIRPMPDATARDVPGIIRLPNPPSSDNLLILASQMMRAMEVTNRRIAAVTINGDDWADGTSWHSLLMEITKRVLTRVPVEKLTQIAPRAAQIIVGRERHDKGFDYYPDLGVSVRGSAAAVTWRVIHELSVAMGIHISVLLDDGTCLSAGPLLLKEPELPLENPQ